VLSGTTAGGYSYDDDQRQNGVFTGSVIDGLRGKAPANAHHFITARTLADYVDKQVRRWIQLNRPQHAQLSTGISQQFDGPAAALPLAVDPVGMQDSEVKAQRQRQAAALTTLYANMDFRGPITGRLADEVAQALESELTTEAREALLSEIEALDGSPRGKRIFADYFNQRREQFGLGHQMRSSPPTPEPNPSTLPEPEAYTLTVRATPSDSRIRIINIRPVYEPGMSLGPGHYHIQVDREGYRTARQWVTIRDQDMVIDIRLEQVVVKGARTQPGPIETRNIATKVDKERWRWSAFIEADSATLGMIDGVEYTLHPTFPNPVQKVCKMGSPTQAFATHATGWGTFKINIRVFFRDGATRALVHQLTFR
jgi:hypothetical protein